MSFDFKNFGNDTDTKPVKAGFDFKSFGETGTNTNNLNVNGAAVTKLGNASEISPIAPYTGNESFFGGLLKSVQNIPSSGLNLVKGIGSMLIHPVQTVKGIGQTAYGLGETAGQKLLEDTDFGQRLLKDVNNVRVSKGLPGLQQTDGKFSIQGLDTGTDEDLNKINQLGQFFADRYGSKEGFKKALIEDPAGIALDVSMVLSGGAGLLGKASDLAKVNELTKTSQILRTASDITGKTSQLIDPIRQGGRLLKATTKGVGEVGKQILGTSTGAGSSSINEALKGSKGFAQAMRGEISPDDMLRTVEDAVQGIKDTRSSQYVEDLKKIGEDTKSHDISSVGKTLNTQLDNFGVKVLDDGSLDFSRSAIANSGSARADVQGVYDTVREWGTKAGDITGVGLDLLKKQLGDFYSDSSQARAFVQAVKSSVTDILKNEVPGYTDMTKKYGQASDFLSDIKSATGVGTKSRADTIFTKLTTAMKADKEFRLEVLKKLQETSGDPEIMAKIAGINMQSWIPRGLVGRGIDVGTGLGVLAGHLNPAIIPVLLLTSPRIVGELLLATGLAANQVSKIVKVLNYLNTPEGQKIKAKIADYIDNTGEKAKNLLKGQSANKNAAIINPNTKSPNILDISKAYNDGGNKSSLYKLLNDEKAGGADKLGSMKNEDIITMFEGWKDPADKKLFDRAIGNKDAKTIKELLPDVPYEYREKFKARISDILNSKPAPVKLKKSVPNKQGGFISTGFKETGGLTTKLLKDLEGRTEVNKSYIEQRIVSGDLNLKQVEKDLARQVLDTMPDKVNVQEFADKMKAELLPLKVTEPKNISAYRGERGRYEQITLPDELRGDVKNYKENVYESPIKTSAGDVHFSAARGGTPENYFGHTRIEDMADNKTRRVIEVQSDLYQKGNLDREGKMGGEFSEFNRLVEKKRYFEDQISNPSSIEVSANPNYVKELQNELDIVNRNLQKYEKQYKARQKELSKLQQYNDPTAHFRMVREEIKKAAEDGKTKLQFPTGETAMKIEGLGDNVQFRELTRPGGGISRVIKPDDLKVGKDVFQGSDHWIITDVLGDGKFKAVPKDRVTTQFDAGGGGLNALQSDAQGNIRPLSDWQETFDISGKVDTSNPIYKFYEKDMGKYLTSRYKAKIVTDSKGVKWYQVDITPEMKAPVEAFGKVQGGILYPIAAGSAALVAGQKLLSHRKEKKGVPLKPSNKAKLLK